MHLGSRNNSKLMIVLVEVSTCSHTVFKTEAVAVIPTTWQDAAQLNPFNASIRNLMLEDCPVENEILAAE